MTLKLILAFVIAFAVSAVVGFFLVPYLKRIKAGQSIKENGPTWHMSKQGTPTMGGLMFIAAIAVVCQVLQMDFVSNVSHEFKTPINAIEGYTMLLQGEELSPDQEEYVEKILFNTQRLSGLVGNILLLSKLENQNIPMKKTEYRLDEQIRQAFLSLETKWTEKEIGFQVELEEVKYTGNEGLLMHIWMNLLDNAIKFSPAKGTITMFLKQEKNSVKFIVEDEGPGIEEDVKTRIFDKFYQVDGSHKAEGNGLGLALVKRIVDSAGGTIKAENREYGGCRFVVELPKQKDEII